ncbi:MAG: RNB domain-containing ribonuclease, partial [Snodgrassella alvi]|nr:RNB domain-containing ribonuclease [Snodgrassella alvi]
DTTEIDDAASLQDLPNGNKLLGLHIAVPSLGILADSALEKRVFEHQSTVYYPGGKITMLPPEWIAAYSLDEGMLRPAISLYLEVNPEFEVVRTETKLESIYVANNLRIQDIEEAFLPEQPRSATEAFPHQHAMNWMYDFGIARMKVRGKYDPDRLPQYDYNIELDENEHVQIKVRERGSPIDTMVSEL